MCKEPLLFNGFVCRHVSNVPAKIWTLIFEYLNLEELVEIESTREALWARIIQRVATKVISGIIAHGKLVAELSTALASQQRRKGRVGERD